MHGEVEQSKVEQSEVVPEPGILKSAFEQWFRSVIASAQGLRSKLEMCFRAPLEHHVRVSVAWKCSNFEHLWSSICECQWLRSAVISSTSGTAFSSVSGFKIEEQF